MILAACVALMGLLPLGAAPGGDGDLTRGRHLFASRHCFYCHRIGTKGGVAGPALDRLPRRRRSESFLRAHFRNPALVTPGSAMPVIPLTETEVRSLVTYVRTLRPGAPIPAIVLPAPSGGRREPSIGEGRRLYQAAACGSCHLIGGKGNAVGPSLDSVGLAGRRPAWLTTLFRDPDRVAPGTIMPAVKGSETQLRSVALYMLSLKREMEPTPSLGQRIYSQRNCGHCHGESARGGKIGPRIAGSRRPGRTDAWLLEHFRDPAGVTGIRVMPRVWAADWELQALLEYLKTLWLQDVPPARPGT